MVIAIAGGGLQGLEVTYLGRKAGFETLLLDRDSDAPAIGICDRFVSLDLLDHGAVSEALCGAGGPVDIVLPATENVRALESLVDWCRAKGVPLAFDPGAHAISSSKKESNDLFRTLGFPVPTSWPDCGFPVLAKPDVGSGSHGVEVLPDQEALEGRFGPRPPSDWVLQEYLPGPAHSIEVLGRPGAYSAIQVTDIEMDSRYDCKRVSAPTALPPDLVKDFEEMGVALAEAVGLSGIMDVEAILHEGRLELLEIDARFPSQTPAAVYHSTGINMVQHLVEVFSSPGLANPGSLSGLSVRGAVVEHVRFREGHLSVGGERMMTAGGPLHLELNLFGADEALTNYSPGRGDWVATLMVSGKDLPTAREKRDLVLAELRDRFAVRSYTDESPSVRMGPVK
ncbi:MAG: 3-methylornithine--L-lysine ligase PylC [Gemmatimonadetes bacterium]|nr:3-methylornithine--L-lysine ligase PylC [Gemmatimonadota bacterium]NNM03693.1 3-methylornithine--L-lysine ligase PylC [Gemmatimonadota bacterium]